MVGPVTRGLGLGAGVTRGAGAGVTRGAGVGAGRVVPPVDPPNPELREPLCREEPLEERPAELPEELLELLEELPRLSDRWASAMGAKSMVTSAKRGKKTSFESVILGISGSSIGLRLFLK